MSWCRSRNHELVSLFLRPPSVAMASRLREYRGHSSLPLFPLSTPINLVRCGLSPLVPTSSIHVYRHHMRIEVPWNQNPLFRLFASLWCSFIALLIQFLRLSSATMASRSKESESLPPLFWLLHARAPCMLVPILGHSTP